MVSLNDFNAEITEMKIGSEPESFLAERMSHNASPVSAVNGVYAQKCIYQIPSSCSIPHGQ